MTDLRQTKNYAKYLKNIGWIVKKDKKVYYFIKKIPLIGSAIKVQRPKTIYYQFLNQLAKKHRAFLIIIEPKKNSPQPPTNYGYKQAKSTYLPSKTIHLDLKKSEKKLMSDLPKKTRYAIRTAEKRGVTVKLSKDIDSFCKFWKNCSLEKRGVFIPMNKEIKAIYKAFGKDANILYALRAKKILAAVLLIIADKAAYYMYAASSQKSRQYLASSFIVWESIKLAKRQGCILYDFEGIYDQRFPIKSWKGFSNFKKSFAGIEIKYPGAYIKWRLPL